MTPNELSILVYNLALLPVVFFSVLFLLLAILNLFADRPVKAHARAKRFPFVTVQIPSFNDPIAMRAVKACLAFDYPKDRYEVMIVDDSTDKKIASGLRAFAKKNGVGFFHRDNREGYKPGALKEVMPHVKGEIIVIFDADFVPRKDFLRSIVVPFEDTRVAIVQARQSIMNGSKNVIARFAAYLLEVFHHIVMPINDRLNTVFFCGTAGAIRKSALLDVGGWNVKSITEDSDLSVRLLAKGYKNVYLKFETPSEVPVTMEAFLKQQMRWCFGSTRVFFDHYKKILGRSALGFRQRLMITFLTLGNFVAPAVILMTIAGFLGWVTGDIRLFGISDISDFALKFIFTAGFMSMGLLMLAKRRSLGEFPQFVVAIFSMGLILAMANSVAMYRAVFRKDKMLYGKQNTSWVCTTKTGNERFR